MHLFCSSRRKKIVKAILYGKESKPLKIYLFSTNFANVSQHSIEGIIKAISSDIWIVFIEIHNIKNTQYSDK
jgi:lipopolysaccharide biosynthesis glycosyltransferase